MNTLDDVRTKAIDDKNFFEDLIADPAAALTQAGMSLSNADLAVLQYALSVGVHMTATEVKNAVHPATTGIGWAERIWKNEP